MIWLNNIINWAITQKDKIILFVTSAEFAGLITLIVRLFKTFKKVDKNTSATNTLNDTISTVNDLKENVTTNTTSVNDCVENIHNVQNEMCELKEQNAVLTRKLDAVLSVMSIAYSKLKDEDARNTINAIITSDRYYEAKLKTTLIENYQSSKKDDENNETQIVENNVAAVEQTVNKEVKKSRRNNVRY